MAATLTSEDFRYTWEDVILNKDLRKGGIQRELLVDGEGPTFEIIDETDRPLYLGKRQTRTSFRALPSPPRSSS